MLKLIRLALIVGLVGLFSYRTSAHASPPDDQVATKVAIDSPSLDSLPVLTAEATIPERAVTVPLAIERMRRFTSDVMELDRDDPGGRPYGLGFNWVRHYSLTIDGTVRRLC